MYGKCKDCAKLHNCHKPVGYRFGFCETDFEPKDRTEEHPAEVNGMQWKQLSASEWEAEGADGKFRIKRYMGKFWARYGSEIYEPFNLPPKDKLSEAKAMCEYNEYWEG